MLDWDYAQRRTVDAASGALLFVRRAAVEDVGLLDEQFFVYYEETDWLLRANQRGWRTLFLPEVEAVHAAGTSTEAGAQALSLLLLESQQSYARKHFGRGITGVLRIGLGLLDLVRAARALLPGTRRSSSTRDYRARVRLHLGGTSTSTDAFRPPTGR
jgi:GT2 family glycosyltransferase